MSCLGSFGNLLEAVVFCLNVIKYAVSLFFCTKQHSIEFHPFCSSQCCSFHVVSSFNDGLFPLIKTSVASAVLKWRNQYCVSVYTYNLFECWGYSAAAVSNFVFFALLLNPWQINIFDITNPFDVLTFAKRHNQAAVNRCRYNRTLQRRSDNSALWQIGRQFFV